MHWDDLCPEVQEKIHKNARSYAKKRGVDNSHFLQIDLCFLFPSHTMDSSLFYATYSVTEAMVKRLLKRNKELNSAQVFYQMRRSDGAI